MRWLLPLAQVVWCYAQRLANQLLEQVGRLQLAREAIKDFKDDAGGGNAKHSLESQTAVCRKQTSNSRPVGQQPATMDRIITKKVAQITYALMLQLVDGLAAITAMDDSATMKKSIGEVMETKQIGLLQEEIGEEKQISALSDESSAML